jgi:pyrroline-5-carboxylate reductase
MLEKGNFRSVIMDAVEAAARRSRELGAVILVNENIDRK